MDAALTPYLCNAQRTPRAPSVPYSYGEAVCPAPEAVREPISVLLTVITAMGTPSSLVLRTLPHTHCCASALAMAHGR